MFRKELLFDSFYCFSDHRFSFQAVLLLRFYNLFLSFTTIVLVFSTYQADEHSK